MPHSLSISQWQELRKSSISLLHIRRLSMLLFRLLLLADAVGVGVVVGGGGGIVVVVTIQPTRIRPCWIYPIISHNQPHSIQSVWSDGRANDPAPRHRENGNGGSATSAAAHEACQTTGKATRAAIAVHSAQQCTKSTKESRVHWVHSLWIQTPRPRLKSIGSLI